MPDRRVILRVGIFWRIYAIIFMRICLFYRKAFDVEGQNSFTDYFRNIVSMILANDLVDVFDNDTSLEFYVNFYADAFVCAIKRWLSKKDCVKAQEFSERLKNCLIETSHKIVKKYAQNN